MEGTQSVDGGDTVSRWTGPAEMLQVVNGQTDNVVTALLMEGWDP